MTAAMTTTLTVSSDVRVRVKVVQHSPFALTASRNVEPHGCTTQAYL